MKHPRLLDQEMFGEEITPEELAEALSNLRYDALADYLSALAAKLQKDSESDGGRGRGKLAVHLQRSVWSLDEARLEIEKAWKICEPYMVSSETT